MSECYTGSDVVGHDARVRAPGSAHQAPLPVLCPLSSLASRICVLGEGWAWSTLTYIHRDLV